ncbi:HDIG domain-containing protein [Proteiniclasticum ruminis]|uniref:HDIG domain-containing protein n=2 Tax=Proteiniclasticum ruminis TaxID=398199 RepID=A0A1I4XQ68_9CLOT|nr:HDIG domain-containing protein [Proteiniclasticum ruminis]
MKKTREEALLLLESYNESPTLRRHAFAVEAVMRHFAEMMEEDPEYWALVGLLHDLDYEKYPEKHCVMTREILQKEGFEESFIRAIESHGYGICTEVPPVLTMEKVLYTIDELTGLIYATVLMRPDKSISVLELKSVKKKFKTASFAQGVNREVIASGAKMLGMDLDHIIIETIEGMKKAKDLLELN